MNEENWVKGRRVERALEKDLGARLSWWPTLIPELSSGAIRVRCKRAVVSDLAQQGTRVVTQPAEEREDWQFPARAWDTVERDSLGHGLATLEGRFEYVRLDTSADLRFLDRSDTVLVSASGLEFERDGLITTFDLGAEAQAILEGGPHLPAPPEPKRSARSNSGRKVDVVRWEKFAAAAAVLFERGEIDPESENKSHEQIATFLMKRGHEDALGVDTIRSLLRRIKAWSEDNPFHDDADYPTGD